MWSHPLHCVNRGLRSGLGGEHANIKHGLKCGIRRGRLALFAAFQPFDQKTPRHIVFSQAFTRNLCERQLDTRSQLALLRSDFTSNLFGQGLKILRSHVTQRLQRIAHALFQDLFAVNAQRMPDSAVFFFFHLQSGKTLQQFGQLLLPFAANAVQEIPDRFVHQPILIQLDAVVLIQGQIARKALDQSIGEAVQRHDGHFAVAMKHRRPERTCTSRQRFGRQFSLVRQLLDERLRRLACAHFGEVGQNPLLHFPSRFVGEGQRQDMAKRSRVIMNQATRQISTHQPVRFPASRRGANNFKGLERFHRDSRCTMCATFGAN